MFVQNHMTERTVTTTPDTAVSAAAEAMDTHRVHQLPVIDEGGRLVGIVTDRDVRSAIGYERSNRTDLKVEEIMTCEPRTVGLADTLEDALDILSSASFNALPVVQHGRVVGIITKQDVLRAFHHLLGLDQPGRRVEVALPHGLDDIAAVLRVLGSDDNITCMVAARLRTDGDEPVLFIRTGADYYSTIERKLRDHGVILLSPERAPCPD